MGISNNSWRVALLFLSFAAAIGLPQDTGSRAGIAGRVTDSATGAPIVRANVKLWGEGKSYGALTDIDGKFSIAQLPGGQYIFSVEAIGFQFPPIYYDAELNQLVLRQGERKNDLNIALTPLSAISGRVLDVDGRPQQGVTVWALSIEGLIEGELSDPYGQYRIGKLPPGKYIVLAQPQNSGNLAPEIRSDGSTEIQHSLTYYPASLAIESAAQLELPPGSERTGIDINLVRTPIVAVRGIVSGIPAGESRVSIFASKIEPPVVEGRSKSSGGWSRANPDGSFVIWRLDPGAYLLTASTNQWTSPPVEVNIADKNIDGVAMHLVQLSQISGKILPNDRRARIPQILPNTGMAETPQIHLQGRTRKVSASSLIAADGSFHFDRVSPEQYYVRIGYVFWGPYVKSMRLGSMNIKGSILDLRNSSEGATLTVTASSSLCQVGGVVRNAAGPVPYARVALLSEMQGIRAEPFVLSADSIGRYAFTHLPPGKYQIMALDAGVANAGALRFFLEDYSDIIETIDIHPGKKLTRISGNTGSNYE